MQPVRFESSALPFKRQLCTHSRTVKLRARTRTSSKCSYIRFALIAVLLASCNSSSPDLRQYVDDWETITKYTVLPNREITVMGKQSQIVQGNNNVLIVELETKPIFKPGHELTDLHSIRSLLIELNPVDSVVRPDMLGSSKLYRRVVAFSPQYGTNNIGKNEKIEIRKIGQNKLDGHMRLNRL